MSRSTSVTESILGNEPAALGAADDGRRIVAPVAFGVKEPVELSDRRQPPRHRGSGKAAAGERCQIGAQVAGRGNRGARPAAGEKPREIVKIAAIGGKGIRRAPAFGRNHVQEQGRKPGRRPLSFCHLF